MLNPRFEEDLALKHFVISPGRSEAAIQLARCRPEEIPRPVPPSGSSVRMATRTSTFEEVDRHGGQGPDQSAAFPAGEGHLHRGESALGRTRIARAGRSDGWRRVRADNKTVRVALNDLYTLIERTLVANNA